MGLVVSLVPLGSFVRLFFTGLRHFIGRCFRLALFSGLKTVTNTTERPRKSYIKTILYLASLLEHGKISQQTCNHFALRTSFCPSLLGKSVHVDIILDITVQHEARIDIQRVAKMG